MNFSAARDTDSEHAPERCRFARFANLAPNAIAVVEYGRREWTRGELFALSNRLARAFDASGLQDGDKVAVIAPNCAEYVAACFACIQRGLYAVPVNWHLTAAELSYMISNSEAKVIVAHERLGKKRLQDIVESAPKTTLRVAIGNADGYVSLGEFVENFSPLPLDRPARGRIMIYTSATTGKPKGVVLPLHNADNALNRILAWHFSLGITPGESKAHLCSSMLYHSAPLEGTLTALHMGHRVVMLDHWRPELLLQVIESFGVTTAFMVPTMFVRLLKLPTEVFARYSTRSLRFVVHAGAPCPIEVKREMLARWGPIIWESYGAAEGQGAIASPDDWIRYPGTVGRPFPKSDFKIVDEKDNELGPGCVGRIYFRPHTGDRFEYKDEPELTRACYRGDYISVGDIGYVNDEGYVFICGRQTDLIISSGMNIYVAEIEQALIQHPEVLDCAVIGVPHEVLGAVPAALIQCSSAHTRSADDYRTLELELLTFLRTQISAMKLPHKITFVTELPRDGNGKMYKRLIAR